MAPEKPVSKEAGAVKPRPPPYLLALTFSMGSRLFIWSLKRTTKYANLSGLKAAEMLGLVKK